MLKIGVCLYKWEAQTQSSGKPAEWPSCFVTWYLGRDHKGRCDKGWSSWVRRLGRPLPGLWVRVLAHR